MTWPKVKLGDVCEIERNGVNASQITSGTTYVGLENIERNGQFSNVATVQNGDLASTKFRFNARHVLYGKLRPYLSKIALPDFEGVCSTDILPLCPKEKLDRNFIFHFLRLPDMIELANSRSSGANLPRLSPRALAEFEIPLPPIAEQKRLALILDAADALRQQRRETLRVLDELAQSLFLELFGDPATNPKGWEVVKLKEAAKSLNGRRIPVEASIRATKDKLYRYYGASGVIDKIDDFIFDEETLLIGEDGANLLSRNSPIAFIVSGKYWVNNHAHVLKMRENIEISYLCFLINLLDLKPYVTGSAQPKLNAANLMNIEIPLPPLALQQQFAAQIEELEAIKRRARESSTRLDALFACLQARAFAGELSDAD